MHISFRKCGGSERSCHVDQQGHGSRYFYCDGQCGAFFGSSTWLPGTTQTRDVGKLSIEIGNTSETVTVTAEAQ